MHHRFINAFCSFLTICTFFLPSAFCQNSDEDTALLKNSKDSLQLSHTTVHQTNAGPMRLDTLAGMLPAVIKCKPNPYIVVSTLEVPVDKTVTIEKGTKFLFKNFTGLHVVGKLVALGTKENPIVFTSENDQNVNANSALLPNPFDWDGIYIHNSGFGTNMAFCSVSFSVYGIVSDTRFIRLDQVLFRSNGKGNLTIESKEQDVGNSPYSYILSANDAMVDGVPVNFIKDPLAAKRNSLRYGGLVAFLAGSACAAYYGVQWHENQESLNRISTDDPLVLKNYPFQDSWTKTRDKRNTSILETAAGALIAVLGATGFWWSFTF